MADDYRNKSRQTGDPAEGAAAVTPNDVAILDPISRALYVGGAGDLAVTMRDGTSVTFTAVPAGTLLPLRVQSVMSTGTTASSIVALW